MFCSFGGQGKESAWQRFIVIVLTGYLMFNIIILAVLWMMVSFIGSSEKLFLLSGLSGTAGIALLIGLAVIYRSRKLTGGTGCIRKSDRAAAVAGILAAVLPVALLNHGQGGWFWYMWTGIGIIAGIACAAASGQYSEKRDIAFCFAMDAAMVVLMAAVLYVFVVKACLGIGAIACVLAFSEMFLIGMPIMESHKRGLIAERKGMNTEAPEKGYGTGFLFQYAVNAITGWIINSLIIWMDAFMVDILGRHDRYYLDDCGTIYFSSLDAYVFQYLIGFAALGGGIFFLMWKNGDKVHSVGKAVPGIVLGAILTMEGAILFGDHVILGVVFMVSLALSLLLGFCVRSVKLWVHMVYYAAAVFLNAGCTMFLYRECIRGRVSYRCFADCMTVIAPFTFLLPLISFDRGRYRPALPGRNVYLGTGQSDSTQRLKQPEVHTDHSGSLEDASSFGYAVLGFFVPVAGLVLWLLWRDTLPLRAKSAGKGALMAVILNVAGVIICVLYFAAIVMRFTF